MVQVCPSSHLAPDPEAAGRRRPACRSLQQKNSLQSRKMISSVVRNPQLTVLPSTPLLQQCSQPALLLRALPRLAELLSSAGPSPVGCLCLLCASVPVCGNLGLLLDGSAPTGHTGWTVLAHLCSCKAPTQVWLAGEDAEGSASVYTVKLTPGRGQGSVTHSPSLKELLAGPTLKGCGYPHKQA